MRRQIAILSLGTFAGIGVLAARAQAANPSAAVCVEANERAIASGNEHKLRKQLSELLVCADPKCPDDIRKECAARIDEVTRAIPSVIFDVKDAAGNDLSAVKVAMDGEALTERLDGTALKVDPGDHKFTFEAQGQPTVERQLRILESQKDLRVSVAPPPPTPPPPTQCAPGYEARPGFAECQPMPFLQPQKAGAPLGTHRMLAIVAGGLGVVGVGVGSVFGLMAISKKNDAQSVCPNNCSTQQGVDKWGDAKSAAVVSDVFFAVGAVGLAAGVALWLTARTPSEPSTQVGVGPDGVRVTGVW
jgi:serine/threonine-protein kinase